MTNLKHDNEDNKNDSEEDTVNELTPILKKTLTKSLITDRPLIENNEEDIECGNKSKISVVSAIKKISQIGDLSTSVNDHSATGQVDDGSYSFEKTFLFGRYHNNLDNSILFQRKSGMVGISPNNTVNNINNKKNENVLNNKLSSLKFIFHQNKKSESKLNIISDFNDDDDLYSSKNKGYRKTIKKIIKFLLADWIFLAALGIIMAFLSFGMDWTIDFLQTEHKELMDLVTISNVSSVARYFLWIIYTILLVSASALFSHYVAPQAIGSGIPEMKTILRGIILKEYLTFRTLISKVVGLTFSLGSGLPIGKEGPFVHVASVVANLLSHLVKSIDGAYTNESRASEMLSAGCAVGVACTFSAPVGGVLFSIEVTSVYFAIRNYWRGFFAAACAATVFRLLRVYTSEAVTVIAFYQTNFIKDSFLPSELPIFALVGLICGILSAAFIFIQRSMVLFLRKNKIAKSVFQKYWLIYPILIALIVSSLTFTDWFGQFIGGEIRFSKAAQDFFQNCTFSETDINSSIYCNDNVRNHWTNNGKFSPFMTLSIFLVIFYFLAAIASTVPIPSGIFGPSFVLGAAIGRLIGELVAYLWKREDNYIYPGVYSVVGAAAFTGGVTHTVSVAVIVFELTGQLLYILPVMIAVLIANAVCSYLQPSIYDSIIRIKHLPYLPDIPHSSSNFHGIKVEQFMTPNVKYLSRNSNYGELQELLINMPRLKSFPIVEDSKSCVLIGSCSRAKLMNALNNQVSEAARYKEAIKRIRKAIVNIDKKFKEVDKKRGSILHGKRLSIFDHLQPNERPINKLSVNFEENSKSDIKNISDDDNSKDQIDESLKDQTTLNASSSNRFTVVAVDKKSETKSNQPETVPGIRPGGRRGGIAFIESDEEENDEKEKKNSGISCQSCSGSMNEENKQKNSTHSGLASFISHLKKDRPKSFNGDFQYNGGGTNDVYHTISGVFRTLTKMSIGKFKNKINFDEYDLTEDEKREWEIRQLSKPINFDEIGVDPAPFQLVENSSLFKVHSLFSLLGLNRAYVTKSGKLVGVVALRDLRIAIEKVQTRQLYADGPSLYEQDKQRNSVGFDGAHLISGADPDDDSEEDIENDHLNPRLEVVSRLSSQCVLSDDDDEVITTPSVSTENGKENMASKPLRKLTSAPCLVTRVDETKGTEDDKYGNTDKPIFKISPSSSFSQPADKAVYRTNTSDKTQLSTLAPSLSSISRSSSSSSTPSKKKHVSIVIPPTPDYKKDNKFFNE